jgi:hypothetical protein
MITLTNLKMITGKEHDYLGVSRSCVKEYTVAKGISPVTVINHRDSSSDWYRYRYRMPPTVDCLKVSSPAMYGQILRQNDAITPCAVESCSLNFVFSNSN